eukprot:2550911-Pyramimonas_sp.AAC.1
MPAAKARARFSRFGFAANLPQAACCLSMAPERRCFPHSLGATVNAVSSMHAKAHMARRLPASARAAYLDRRSSADDLCPKWRSKSFAPCRLLSLSSSPWPAWRLRMLSASVVSSAKT